MKNWLENYNNSKVTTPEGFHGDGYTSIANNKNPAWGGQFQMGGTLPGATGMMYSRHGAPSNGKHAKKTKASALNGKEMQYYQEGLDWQPKSIAQNGDTIKINDPRKIRATTQQLMNPNTDSVTGRYQSNIINNIINASLKNGVKPETALALAMQESKLGNLSENLGQVVGGSYQGQEAEDMTRLMSDKFATARKLGRKTDEAQLQIYNGSGMIYPDTEKIDRGYSMKKIYGVPVPKEGINMGKTNLYGKQVVDIRDNVIKKNPQIMNKIKELSGNFNYFEGMPYNKRTPQTLGEELFINPDPFTNMNPKSFKEGGIIKDDNGYWNPDNWGKPVEIGSNQITMQGVNQDLLGISNTGDTKLMKPGKDYKFKGKKVIEYPIVRNGTRQSSGQLTKLDQLTNFSNYNTPQKGGWLDKI